LFGAGFLDDRVQASTQTENALVSPVHKTAVDHMCNFNWIDLQNKKCSHGGAVEHNELLVDSDDGTIIAETQENPRGGHETDHSKWSVNCAANFNWIGLPTRNCNYEDAVEQSDPLVDSDSTIIAETQEKPPGGHETEYSKHPVNSGGTGLAARTDQGFLEDGIQQQNLPVNSHIEGLVDTGIPEKNLQELFGAGFLNDSGETNESTSQLVLSVQRNAVDPLWKCNWIGLRNIKHSHEGTVQDSDLQTDSEGTCIAETQENPPGGQDTDHSKRPVNCGGTSLADTEECFLKDGTEHSKLPIKSHSKGLANTGKPKRSLRSLFGASFLDDPDEANDSETRVVSTVQRNAADETQENPPGGQVIEHKRLPVNCGGTCLAADTVEGFLEDGIEHCKLPANSHSTGAADIMKTDIDYHILPVDSHGIGSAVTEKGFSGDETNRANPTLNHKKTEGTVAADGFIAIRKEVKPAEECRAKKIPKPSRTRQTAHLQENCGILETPNALARDRTRSPLSERTNILEVAGAPGPQISGKWKCPRKGKPYVSPPMKQLRLEQWVRRVD
jgi:hypothetical protein